jgi:hypothetical protein
MRRFALLRPTELAQLAELSERHEELMQQLETGAAQLQDPRELQIELRQLRQETLKVLASVQQKIEALP